MRIVFLGLFLFFVSPAFAHKERTEYDHNKVWLGPPAAALLGFGMGHLVQDRYQGYPIAFTSADALGFLLILGSMGSCNPADSCRKSKDRIHDLGLGILIASRIAQVVDTTIWSVNHHARFAVVPRGDGAAVTAYIQF